jgi:hypothetical protein
MPGDPPPDRYETKLVTEALELHAKGMERDRNLLEFSQETDRAIPPPARIPGVRQDRGQGRVRSPGPRLQVPPGDRVGV